MSRILLAVALVIMSVVVLDPSSARAAGSGPPNLVLAGEIAGASSYDHVILLWDERLDQRVTPVAGEFFVTVDSIEQPAAGASYLLSGLGGPDSFIDASGTTIMRLDLQPGTTVDANSIIQIRYAPGATPLRDLSLTPAAPFAGFSAQVHSDFGIHFIAAFVDADHGANRVALTFSSQLDLSSIPAATDFVVTITRGAGSFTDAVTAVQPIHPDLGMGIVDLVLTTPVALGDTVAVSYTPGANPLRQRGGALMVFDPITDSPALLSLASDVQQSGVAPNGTVSTSTGAEPTTFDPIATTVTSPIAATVTLNEVQVSSNPPGYTFFGQQVVIKTSADATVDAPFVFRFELDASLVPLGETKDTLVVLRDGEPVGPCTEAVRAVPTPCVALRELLGVEGDIAITVRTAAASTWNFATVRPYTFGGFLQPVDHRPMVNTTTAGRAIPVKFSLGGDRGMAILAAGSPASQLIPCDALASLDPVETTVSLGSSTLTYSPGADTYTYVWKTDKAWAGTCRRLLITFGDGSTAEALFNFGK